MTDQDLHDEFTADTEAPQQREVEGDVVSDPNLDDPTDPDDEGTSSDWTSEGGAMAEGPATDAGPVRE